MKTAHGLMLTLMLFGMACSHAGGAHVRRNDPPLSKRTSATVIATGAGTEANKNPLDTLEGALSSVKSDRVTVSTALLKSLVRNQRLQQTQCKNLSGQLEALKNVDLEETGEVKE